MFGSEHERDPEFNSQYATSTDYCRIFQQEMSSLYLLSFLLTANHARAEQCYLDAIERAFKGNRVFKKWAGSWSRRCVIQSAIQLVFSDRLRGEVRDPWGESPLGSVIDVVTRLAPLERFVFAMSVLERYSNRECSVLLNHTVRDVINVRLRALTRLAEFDPVFTSDKRTHIRAQRLVLNEALNALIVL
jgi:DNA-directed RNA polymerase specialized sigma24 family protein